MKKNRKIVVIISLVDDEAKKALPIGKIDIAGDGALGGISVRARDVGTGASFATELLPSPGQEPSAWTIIAQAIERIAKEWKG